MQYTIPTTSDELYATLKEIFVYYRVKYEPYEITEMTPLELEEMNFAIKTDEQLRLEATVLLSGSQEREKFKKEQEINEKISVIEEKLAELPITETSLKESVNQTFVKELKAIRLSVEKSGTEMSNVLSKKAEELYKEKEIKLEEITRSITEKRLTLNAEKSALIEERTSIPTLLATVFGKEIDSKTEELKSKQTELSIEQFKYNNSVAEKLTKYINGLEVQKATLELKLMELRKMERSNEELLSMGYYKDAMNCVCDYLYSLSASDAYSYLLSHPDLSMYLDEYYQNILYNFKLRADI